MSDKKQSAGKKRQIRIETLRDMIKPKHGYRIATVEPIIGKDGKVLPCQWDLLL